RRNPPKLQSAQRNTKSEPHKTAPIPRLAIRGSSEAEIVAKMAAMKLDLEAAHKHSFKSRKETMASELCGCFYCLATFLPAEIEEWTDDGQTPLCPKCGIDSV